jgi:hypothetical protein
LEENPESPEAERDRGGLQAGVQHRRRVDWGEMHRYRIKYDEVTKTYHMKGILMHAKHT